MSDKQKGSSSSTKDVQLNSNPNEVRSFEELEHCLEEYGRCEDCQQPNTGIKWCKSCNAERFKNQEWRRSGVDSWKGNGFVCLKRFNDSANMTSEFFEEIRNQLKFRKNGNAIPVYGITKDPSKEDYMIILKYAVKGSLRQNLDKNYDELSWDNKLNSLLFIAKGLADIHKEGLLHKDFHVDAEPNNRVSAKELTDILTQYYKDVHVKNKEAKIYQQIEAIEKSTESSGYKPNKSTRLSYATHTQAIYTSRLLDYGNLPNPVNYTPEESKQLELVIPDSNDYTFEDEDN
ncbi:2128_t:CDS:2 [Entrophospora sp. SA101]|nr:2128_t:CDS:2 [Entrophospora sp. SA101]